MKCMYCSSLDSKVVDSRPTDEGMAIRRRRECINCGRRFTTYEKTEEIPLIVIKHDGSREQFDPDKVARGIRKSSAKRNVSEAKIESLVADVMKECYSTLEQEVPTSKIGEMVLRRLSDVDEVAYIRFASVYRSFDDVPSFMEELNMLMESRTNE